MGCNLPARVFRALAAELEENGYIIIQAEDSGGAQNKINSLQKKVKKLESVLIELSEGSKMDSITNWRVKDLLKKYWMLPVKQEKDVTVRT